MPKTGRLLRTAYCLIRAAAVLCRKTPPSTKPAQNWQNLLTRLLANKGLDGLRENVTKWDTLKRLVKFSEMYTKKNALKIKRLMI